MDTSGLQLPYFEEDGKQRVSLSPATIGWKVWLTSKGDVAGQRGQGDPLRLSWSDGETGAKSVSVSFSEPLELHDGSAFWEGLSWDDYFRFSAELPASAGVGNAGGNATQVANPSGGHLFAPAGVVGPASHDVDLALAVPVPAPRDANGDKTGFWDVDYDTGLITPAEDPGKASWHLLDVPVSSFMLPNVSCGNPLRVFDLDTYLTQWVHQNWQIKMEVERATNTGTAEFGAWVQGFRLQTTIA